MKFDVFCTSPKIDGDTGDVSFFVTKYVYDNETSEIFDSAGEKVAVKPYAEQDFSKAKEHNAISQQNPGRKKSPKKLKISFGLQCNYSCSYCSQKFIERPGSEKDRVAKFLANVDKWVTDEPHRVEFWGGEPLVYFKQVKPLAEGLRTKWPNASFGMVTNGSLLTDEIVDWLYDMGFSVGLSHDGPGQKFRGPDPLDDPEKRRVILRMADKFLPYRMSFNAMLHAKQFRRKPVQEYFDAFLEGRDYVIGEGEIITAYDPDGLADSFQTAEEHWEARRVALIEIERGEINRFGVMNRRPREWINSWGNERPIKTIGVSCDMDMETSMTVDLSGNVLTCQNASAVSTAPNGRSHLIGHVSNLENVRLTTGRHWSTRDNCAKCPIVQQCRGTCMFLEDEIHDVSCDNAFTDYIPFFAYSFERATGSLPFAVVAHDGSTRPERAMLWGKNIRRPHDVDADKQS